MVTAVRRPDGEVVVDKQPLPKAYTGKLRSTPLIRGIIVLIESLVFGIQTLMYSANVAIGEEDSKEMSGGGIWVALAVSMVFAVAFFFLGPLFLTKLFSVQLIRLFSVWTKGLIRLAMFLIYLWLVSLMPDIKRVFAYHGAEHKAVNGYEAGVPSNRKQSRNTARRMSVAAAVFCLWC